MSLLKPVVDSAKCVLRLGKHCAKYIQAHVKYSVKTFLKLSYDSTSKKTIYSNAGNELALSFDT